MAIPHILHQIWYQGKHTIPKDYIAFMSTWLNLESMGWSYKLWDSVSIEQLMKRDTSTWDGYCSLTSMIEKIDFAKFVILSVAGGVYVDMDSFLLPGREQRFVDMFDHQDFLICEHNVSKISVHMNILIGLRSCKILLNNALIASTPNHPIIEIIIGRVKKSARHPLLPCVPIQFRCLYTSGPNVVSNVIIRRVSDWQSHIIEKYVFEPFHPIQMKRIIEKMSLPRDADDLMDHMNKMVQENRWLRHRTLAVHMGDLNWVQNQKKNKIIRFFENICSMYEITRNT